MSRWNEDLRQKMEGYEASAPEGLFDDIMAALPIEGMASTSAEGDASTRRGAVVWLRRAVAVAAVAAVVVVGYLLLPNSATEQSPIVADNILQSEGGVQPYEAEPDMIAMNTSTGLPAEPSQSIKSIEQVVLSVPTEQAKPTVQAETSKPTQTAEQAVPTQPTEPSQKTEPTQKIESTKKTEPTQAPQSPRSNPSQGYQNRYPTYGRVSGSSSRRTSALPTAKSASRLVANLFASGFSGGRSGNISQQVYAVNQSLFGTRIEGEGNMSDIFVLDSKREISTHTRHHQPIRVGFSLRYGINDRWAVESGLAYSKLSSEATSGQKKNYYNEQLSLHYIGLPLNVVYNIWEVRVIKLYASAGGMIEKSVSGRLDTDYVVDGEPFRSSSLDISVSEVQWSVNAAVGAEVKLSPSIGIYAEPGIGYWFDNGSQMETIYSDRPLNFNLNLGLRFTLR